MNDNLAVKGEYVDANTVTLIVGIISPLATLAAGFGGVWWASRLAQDSLRIQREEERKRNEEERNRTIANVRTLIRLEITQDVSALKARWDDVNQHIDALAEGDQMLKQVRFLKEPFPIWSSAMWESQAPHLPDAFSNEHLMHISDMHAQARMLVIARSVLPAPSDELIRRYDNWKAELPEHRYAKQEEVRGLLSGYTLGTSQQWEECRARVDGILRTTANLNWPK